MDWVTDKSGGSYSKAAGYVLPATALGPPHFYCSPWTLALRLALIKWLCGARWREGMGSQVMLNQRQTLQKRICLSRKWHWPMYQSSFMKIALYMKQDLSKINKKPKWAESGLHDRIIVAFRGPSILTTWSVMYCICQLPFTLPHLCRDSHSEAVNTFTTAQRLKVLLSVCAGLRTSSQGWRSSLLIAPRLRSSSL